MSCAVRRVRLQVVVDSKTRRIRDADAQSTDFVQSPVLCELVCIVFGLARVFVSMDGNVQPGPDREGPACAASKPTPCF